MPQNLGKHLPIGKHRLPPLPYPYDALEPIISEDTLRIHHNHHHKAYVESLNKAEVALARARESDDYTFVKYWENELAFNGSGHILHSIYWTILAPRGSGGEPGRNTLNEIIRRFGSFDAFIGQLVAATIKVEASGWGILVWNPSWNSLEIITAEKHQNLTQWGSIPILVLDVWEHAYYLDYQYNREEYVRSILKLINWNEVENRLALAMRGKLPLIL
ncbi:superoxide dismutase [Sporomusa malonica]|uniref:Superoxide dismutase n=1 Tax=Sporomusa malonica TaxID=112901 RepID=A0A1W2F1K0_9FIRM|nr:superoxide dismutase [Sporomusa malonica]SMD15328.1 superoxide dismutase, Fe-Mn family [Sporomusa malonica]